MDIGGQVTNEFWSNQRASFRGDNYDNVDERLATNFEWMVKVPQ